MKKINILLLLLLSGFFFSCNKWLEVNPKNEISKEFLFSDAIGFQNALNGIYQICSEPALYGRSLSWGALSAVAQNYSSATDYVESFSMNYSYGNQNIILMTDGIWKGLYNAIANCNMLIQEVSKAPSSVFALDTITKNLITGEALALRAMCHFDLVRLFAPAIVNNPNATLIPYHDTYPSRLTIPLTTIQTMDRVIADLLEAKDLLAYNDTIFNKTQMQGSYRFQGTTIPTGGEFFMYRGHRLNYSAVVGLLARAYLYKGDMENALKYARHLYDRFIMGNRFFIFNSSSDYSTSLVNKQKKFTNECIFAFYNKNLLNIIETYYASKILPVADVENIYLNDEDDYRLYLIEYTGSKYENSIKYRQVNSTRDKTEGSVIPVLRMSEIYYTLIECYFDNGNVTEALRLLKEFRSAKGCKRQITSINSKSELNDILINDARREFVGEGQLFFMYKRLNYNILYEGGGYPPTEERMTFIIPDSQNIN